MIDNLCNGLNSIQEKDLIQFNQVLMAYTTCSRSCMDKVKIRWLRFVVCLKYHDICCLRMSVRWVDTSEVQWTCVRVRGCARYSVYTPWLYVCSLNEIFSSWESRNIIPYLKVTSWKYMGMQWLKLRRYFVLVWKILIFIVHYICSIMAGLLAII